MQRNDKKSSTLKQPLSRAQAEKLVRQQPQNPLGWHSLSLTLLQEGCFSEAYSLLSQALEILPDQPSLQILKAHAAFKTGSLEEARSIAEGILQEQPSHMEALLVIARVLNSTESLSEAMDYLQKVESISPGNLDCQELKANTLMKLGELDRSLELFDELTEKASNRPTVWLSRANLLYSIGRYNQADESYKKAIDLSRGDPLPLSTRIFAMHYNPEARREDIFQACLEWNRLHAPAGRVSRAKPADQRADRQLRVGMISDGLRGHPVGWMTAGALAAVKKEQIEFFAYSSSHIKDTLTDALKTVISNWREIQSLSDAALYEQIVRDGIDILIDMSGHTSGTRMKTIVMEPAPIIIKWVGGLMNTTGVKAVDYLISDNNETPAGDDEFYTEKLIRLPDDYICFTRPPYTPPVSELPANSNGYITLGCFNNAAKVNDALLRQWAEIMHEIPGARLFLKSSQYRSEHLKGRIFSVMEECGVSRDRLRIEGSSPHDELLKLYGDVDIALDTWPYSGGLTTCEALLMGVPVVTLPGPTFAGRHSATHLINAGMPELVTSSWDEYRARVIELASDLDSLATIRRHLRDVLKQSPVCDAPRFARNFSNALRAIWQRYCDGKTPAALSIDQEGQAWFEDEQKPMELHFPSTQANDAEGNFQFQFEGQIITLDHGGLLVADKGFSDLQALGVFATIAFDPCNVITNAAELQGLGELHHYPYVALGDGAEATLYTCLDPAMTGTLEPLPAERQLPNHQQGTQVLARLPITTLRLDDIEGLDSIDWLLLDNMNDSLSILENGEKALANTLLVQVRVNFVPTHKNQPELTQISHWLSRHGFSFYRLNNLQHYSHLPKSGNFIKAQASQLMAADAIFIPNKPRLESLNKNNLIKLGLILHTVYGIEDLTSKILEKHSEHREKYLISAGYLKSAPLTHPKTVEEALRKLENCKTAARQGSHSLPGKLLVSLTSYKDRFDNLHLTLRSLLCQNTRPEKTILWISESEKDLLPQNVLKLQEKGLEIRYCEDLRSYKKIIPALQEFPDWFIVTADDDIYYNDDWLGSLITAWNGDPKSIVAHRAHKIKLDKDGNPIKYKDWDWECRADKNPDGLIVPTGSGGVLYPPKCLHSDSCLKDNFKTLCADTDDIWLYWMASINGSKAMLSNYKFKLIEWPQNKATPLWHKNISEGNDKNIKLMISRYGKPWEENSSRKAKEIHSTFTHKGRTVNFYLPNHEDHIQKIIKSSRSFYELEMLEDIASRCNPNGSIIDIGANIGNHTVFFGLFCGCRKIYSFEPQENVFKTLQENIKTNNLGTKVKAFMLGLGETESHATLGDVDPKNLGMTKLNKVEHGQIKIMPLESLIDPSEQISIIKIDVEGMEVDVLSGAKSLLKKQSPAIYAEAGTPEEFARLRSFLSEYGYTPKSRFNATATYLFEK